MTSPRTPRQWNAGDTIPEFKVDRLRTPDGTEIQRRIDRDPLSRWWSVDLGGNRFGPDRLLVDFLSYYGELSEVLPETPEPPREDGPRSDAPTLWRRLQVAARVIKAFKPEDPSPELIAFLRDIRDAVDGDLLEDELSGDLMRFARGQGRLLTALLASQDTEERA